MSLHALTDLDQTWYMYFSSRGKNARVVSYLKTNLVCKMEGKGSGHVRYAPHDIFLEIF